LENLEREGVGKIKGETRLNSERLPKSREGSHPLAFSTTKNYGVSLNLSLGYNVTSLMFLLPVNIIVSLSNPIAQPAWGGIP